MHKLISIRIKANTIYFKALQEKDFTPDNLNPINLSDLLEFMYNFSNSLVFNLNSEEEDKNETLCSNLIKFNIRLYLPNEESLSIDDLNEQLPNISYYVDFNPESIEESPLQRVIARYIQTSPVIDSMIDKIGSNYSPTRQYEPNTLLKGILYCNAHRLFQKSLETDNRLLNNLLRTDYNCQPKQTTLEIERTLNTELSKYTASLNTFCTDTHKLPDHQQHLLNNIYIGGHERRSDLTPYLINTIKNPPPSIQPLLAFIGLQCQRDDFKLYILDNETFLVPTKSLMGAYNHGNSVLVRHQDANNERGLLSIGKKTRFHSPEKVFSVLVHECCHYMIDVLYQNQCHPYLDTDKDSQQLVAEMVEDLKLFGISSDVKGDPILERSLTKYPSLQHPVEIIVRPLQMIAAYGQKKAIQDLFTDCPKLINYFFEKVMKDLANYLEINGVQTEQTKETFDYKSEKVILEDQKTFIQRSKKIRSLLPVTPENEDLISILVKEMVGQSKHLSKEFFLEEATKKESPLLSLLYISELNLLYIAVSVENKMLECMIIESYPFLTDHLGIDKTQSIKQNIESKLKDLSNYPLSRNQDSQSCPQELRHIYFETEDPDYRELFIINKIKESKPLLDDTIVTHPLKIFIVRDKTKELLKFCDKPEPHTYYINVDFSHQYGENYGLTSRDWACVYEDVVTAFDSYRSQIKN
jgi:hypothetical protein